jgi:hypothetical protein
MNLSLQVDWVELLLCFDWDKSWKPAADAEADKFGTCKRKLFRTQINVGNGSETCDEMWKLNEISCRWKFWVGLIQFEFSFAFQGFSIVTTAVSIKHRCSDWICLEPWLKLWVRTNSHGWSNQSDTKAVNKEIENLLKTNSNFTFSIGISDGVHPIPHSNYHVKLLNRKAANLCIQVQQIL